VKVFWRETCARAEAVYYCVMQTPPISWTTRYRNLFAAAIVLFAVFFALTSTAGSTSWKEKDWTQWTKEDCKQVLSDSPWASAIAIGGDNAQNRVGTFGPVADVVSALVVRQAIVRQHQLGPGYGPEQIQRDAVCLGESFDDQIVFRFSGSLVFRTPPDLIVSGARIHPLEGPKVGATACVSDWGNDIAYPKSVDGKSIFKSSQEKLVIKTDLNTQPSPASRDGRNDSQFIPVNSSFEFNTKSMVYKGKPDF
jgi:hypothetical protein